MGVPKMGIPRYMDMGVPIKMDDLEVPWGAPISGNLPMAQENMGLAVLALFLAEVVEDLISYL